MVYVVLAWRTSSGLFWVGPHGAGFDINAEKIHQRRKGWRANVGGEELEPTAWIRAYVVGDHSPKAWLRPGTCSLVPCRQAKG